MNGFNLIDEPWIPCIDLDGNPVEHGIRDTFLKAHELREICDDSPLVTVAIHRLLLAILYRAHKGPTEMQGWKALYRRGQFEANEDLDQYLRNWHSRFNLFDNCHPFMQVAGLDLNDYKNGQIEKEKSDGLMQLIREAPDKKGRILFDHRMGTNPIAYEPKQIARMILSAQSFSGTGVAASGKLGNRTITPTPRQFAPCVDGLVLWLEGENLFSTLMLNLLPLNYNPNDKPAWEDNRIANVAIKSWKKPVKFTGPVQRFAPLSRFILVLNHQSMFLTNGIKFERDSDDPMKAYSRADPGSPYEPLKLRPDKAAWRDAHTLFSLSSQLSKPPASLNHLARLMQDGTIANTGKPKANIVGMATDQNKVLLWRHERIPVPLRILLSNDLTERLGQLISEAENVGKKLSTGFSWKNGKVTREEPVGRIQAMADLVLDPSLELLDPGILRTVAGHKPQKDHDRAAHELSKNLDPLPVYWARMEKHFFALLEYLPNDWDSANNDWKPDDQQNASNAWRSHVKKEAQTALQESIRSLGTTARAIQAVARVGTLFNDEDLMHRPQAAGAKRKSKGGKRK